MGQEIFDKSGSFLEFVFLVTGTTVDHQYEFFMPVAFFDFYCLLSRSNFFGRKCQLGRKRTGCKKETEGQYSQANGFHLFT
jgi:hypothetical protein